VLGIINRENSTAKNHDLAKTLNSQQGTHWLCLFSMTRKLIVGHGQEKGGKLH